jgi:hypothetical protein
VTFAIGLTLGGLGPRSQLRAAEHRLDEMADQVCENTGVGSELVDMIASRSMGSGPNASPERTVLQEGRVSDSENATEIDVTTDAGPVRIEVESDWTNSSDEELDENRLEALRETMDARRAIARQSLRETAWVSDEQMTDIDSAYDAMNEDLYSLATELVNLTADGVEPSRRDVMILAADTLDVMIDAEQAVYDLLDSEQLEHVEPDAVDPFSYIDGSVLEALQEIDR